MSSNAEAGSSKMHNSILLPDKGRGTYVFILFWERDKDIVIGSQSRSSSILFRGGYYAYVGSAQAPGGLRSRINRHLIKKKKSVWHIDYLRKEAMPVEIWVEVHEKKQEKIWAEALVVMKGSHPVENFGNSDDRKSLTHACHFKYRPFFGAFRGLITIF